MNHNRCECHDCTQARARWYMRHTGFDRDEGFDGQHALNEEEMNRLIFIGDHGELRETFSEHLGKLLQKGERFPCFFATTEY